jgi:hypothetical protein
MCPKAKPVLRIRPQCYGNLRFVSIIVIRVSDTTHLVALDEVCVADTNCSVTDINVYVSHIGACVTETDANTADMWDFVTESEGFISSVKLLFPILRWACTN